MATEATKYPSAIISHSGGYDYSLVYHEETQAFYPYDLPTQQETEHAWKSVKEIITGRITDALTRIHIEHDIEYLSRNKNRLQSRNLEILKHWMLVELERTYIQPPEEFWSPENLQPHAINQLIIEAQKIRVHAFADEKQHPYGAALLTKHGCVFHGCNITAESLKIKSCAERSALSQAVSKINQGSLLKDSEELVAIVILAREKTPPCEDCFPSLRAMNPHMKLILASIDGSYIDYNPEASSS